LAHSWTEELEFYSCPAPFPNFSPFFFSILFFYFNPLEVKWWGWIEFGGGACHLAAPFASLSLFWGSLVMVIFAAVL
jgi:hypothetical protein